MYKRCGHKGCKKYEYVLDGGFCQKHGKGLCSVKFCTNIEDKGGLCIIHGTEMIPQKRCSQEGCQEYEYILDGGVCKKHKVVCEQCSFDEGCTNKVEQGGVCKMHCAMIKQKNPETPYDSFVVV
jgi:hypothetical protein